MLTCYGDQVRLPQNDLVYVAFRLALQETLSDIELQRDLEEEPDSPRGFRVKDSDIVVLEKPRDKEDVVFEDRVEMFFSRHERMKDYYAIEIDSRGRAFDYRGSYYRKLDPAWSLKGLQTKGSLTVEGYVVEGRIPLTSFEELGFPRFRPGTRILVGLYRAEFSHDRSGRSAEPLTTIHNRGRRIDGPLPIEEWMSWLDPKTAEPDFHLPSSRGCFEVVK
ncbi:MAG: hypothetical protein ACLQNE_30100 [Thermoguttaceae bacterium]